MSNRIAGGIAGFFLVFVVAFTVHQYRTWLLTAEGVYLISTGFYLLSGSVLFAGVAWGFFGRTQAKRIFTVGGGFLVVLCFLAAGYHLITGVVLGSEQLALFATLTWGVTGGMLGGIVFGSMKVAAKLRPRGTGYNVQAGPNQMLAEIDRPPSEQGQDRLYDRGLELGAALERHIRTLTAGHLDPSTRYHQHVIRHKWTYGFAVGLGILLVIGAVLIL